MLVCAKPPWVWGYGLVVATIPLDAPPFTSGEAMTAPAFFLSGALMIVAALVSGTVSYHAGMYAGEARGMNAATDRAELRNVERKQRESLLLKFMISEGRCPPIDMTCPAIRMTSR